MRIVKAAHEDVQAVSALALALWPENEPADLQQEMAKLLASDEAAIFLLQHEDAPAGFAQCQLRHDYVEGTSGSPVGYLEGIYVDAACRREKAGTLLVQACINWAKAKGCKEFASDCELENTLSIAFHLGAGFQEAGRIVCFVKKI